MTGLDGSSAAGSAATSGSSSTTKPEPRLRLTRDELFERHARAVPRAAGRQQRRLGGRVLQRPADPLRAPPAHHDLHRAELAADHLRAASARAPVESFDPLADSSAAAAVLAAGRNRSEGPRADGWRARSAQPFRPAERWCGSETARAPCCASSCWRRRAPRSRPACACRRPGTMRPRRRSTRRSTTSSALLWARRRGASPSGATAIASTATSRCRFAPARATRRAQRRRRRRVRRLARCASARRTSPPHRARRASTRARRRRRLEPDGHDYVLLDTAGTGHVVGVVLTAGCAEAGRCQLPQVPGLDGAHLEGDERVVARRQPLSADPRHRASRTSSTAASTSSADR